MSLEPRRSAWRLKILRLYQDLGGLLSPLPSSLATFAGIVYASSTRCGKSRCRCMRGQPHRGWCVAYIHHGRRVHRTIRPDRVQKMRQLAMRYRALRRKRAALVDTFGRLVMLLDRLERSLRMSPDRALPPLRIRREESP